jgi:hypothetical protein
MDASLEPTIRGKFHAPSHNWMASVVGSDEPFKPVRPSAAIGIGEDQQFATSKTHTVITGRVRQQPRRTLLEYHLRKPRRHDPAGEFLGRAIHQDCLKVAKGLTP